MDTLKSRNYLLLIPLVFVLYLGAEVLSRSRERRSILDTGPVDSDAVRSFAERDTVGDEGSKIFLQDFHRVEVRSGRVAWEIKARDAKYYSSASEIDVSDAWLLVHRERGSSVELSSKSARLHSDGKSIQRVDLEGDVRVVIDEELRIAAELAAYDVESEKVEAPGRVLISGNGFEIRGVNLDFDVARMYATLSRDVSSVIREGAEFPSGARILSNG